MEKQIIVTARHLFYHYGIRSVTMDDIAHRAGISKKTIYQFYTDKESLVNTVFDQLLEKVKSVYLKQSRLCSNALEEAVVYMRLVHKLLYNLERPVLFDLKKYYPDCFNKIQAFRNKFLYQRLLANIKRGISEGLYRPQLNAAVICRYKVASFLLAMHPALFSSAGNSPQEIQRQLLLYHLHGIVSDKGRVLLENYGQEPADKYNIKM